MFVFLSKLDLDNKVIDGYLFGYLRLYLFVNQWTLAHTEYFNNFITMYCLSGVNKLYVCSLILIIGNDIGL